MPLYKIVRFILYKTIIFLSIDDLISWSPFLFKHFYYLLPGPNFYKPNSQKKIKRKGVRFNVFPYDLVQCILYKNPKEAYGIEELKLEIKQIEGDLTIIDVGANVGQFSLMAGSVLKNKSYSSFKIYAFEPVRKTFDLLAENVKLNPALKNNIELVQIGCSNNSEQREILVPIRNTGAANVNGVNSELEYYKEKIDLRRLDDVVYDTQIKRIHFIKIDTEGFDPYVISGAEELIKKDKPGLFFEILPINFKTNEMLYLNCINYLEALGYNLFIVDNNQRYAYTLSLLVERSKHDKEFSIYASCLI